MAVTEYPEHTVYDPGVDVYYVPFVGDDGRVGYRVGTTDGSDRETFIYFNPSVTDGDADEPNVFVYIGGDNDPAVDSPQHCYAPEFASSTANEPIVRL